MNTWLNGYVIEKECKKPTGLNYECRVQNPSSTDFIWNTFRLLVTAVNKQHNYFPIITPKHSSLA